jgi:Winged helix DNA-binding domain
MEPDTFSSFSAILTHAESLTGEIAIAPRTGAEAAFVRTDQWLQRPGRRHPSAARKALVRRYLQLYGPSTVEEFTSWAGIGESFGRRSWGLVESELTEVGFDGRSGFVVASNLQALQAAVPPWGVWLLPPYEPYLQQRDRVTAVPDVSRHRRIWRSTGNPGVILSTGEVRGLWRHRKQGRRLLITVESLGTVDREALEHEAQPYVAFRGCSSLDLVIG